MKTIQIAVAVPEGARWMTTDKEGAVSFWRGSGPPLPEVNRTYPESEGDFYSRSFCARTRAELEAMPEPTMRIATIQTGIPCPTWRDSLVELTEPEGGEG